MSESIDDRLAAAVAHDGVIVRAISSSAPTIARAWETSAVRRWWQPMLEAFGPLTSAERLRYGCVALAAAVVTRLLLLLL
jgi:hypothetical protein